MHQYSADHFKSVPQRGHGAFLGNPAPVEKALRSFRDICLPQLGHSLTNFKDVGMAARNRCVLGTYYLDRAAPVFAPAKFRVLAFSIGPLIELDCGSNCPGRIIGPGKPATAWRFLIFCAALAFARWRALALVMGSVPLRVAGGSLAVSWPDVLIGDPADRPEWK